MSNIYYNPEHYGLTVVAEIDYSSGFYEFDTRVVWKDGSGKLWTMRDSGCSCPTPFENYNLSNIAEVNLSGLENEVRAEGSKSCAYISAEQGQEFLNKVRSAINNHLFSF